MSDTSLLNEILDRLDINSGDLIYLHTSYKYLAYLKLAPQEILNALLGRIGPNGTLAMPSFTWAIDRTKRPWEGYLHFFQQAPVYDVQNTPSTMGIVTELFRQMPGTHRNSCYFLPICASGPLAQELTRGQTGLEHIYGPGSSFEMLRLHGVKILGLGVTLNTTSLAPIVDFQLGPNHYQQVFTPDGHIGTVVDSDKTSVKVKSYPLLPDVVRMFKPQNVIDKSERLLHSVKRADVGDTIQFSYPFQIYFEEAMKLGHQANAAAQPVPWLPEIFPVKTTLVRGAIHGNDN